MVVLFWKWFAVCFVCSRVQRMERWSPWTWAWPTETTQSVNGSRWPTRLNRGSSTATSLPPRSGNDTRLHDESHVVRPTKETTFYWSIMTNAMLIPPVLKLRWRNHGCWLQFVFRLTCLIRQNFHVFQTFENEGRYYECDLLPFMEVGSVAHKYYLLNIRLPVNERKKINVGIGEIKDIRLVVSCCSSLWQLWP